MKKVYVLTSILLMVLASLVWYGCTKDKVSELPGVIYGTVTDFATGQPIGNANVKLRQTGETTLTGSDGSYEFQNVPSGSYSINVSKAEYTDLIDDYVIVVSDGKKVRRDVQIQKLPSALRIVNSNGEDISVLDFGAEADVTSRTFSIFNDSPGKITWYIDVVDCGWISSVKSMLTDRSAGEIEPGRQEPVMVKINRSGLADGLNTYMLNINSDNGSKELKITAGEEIGLPSLTTEPVSNTTQTSVTFNGTIINEGLPPYDERGFVYSTSAQPTYDDNVGRITAVVNGQASFSANQSGLEANHAYYVRAYAKNTVGVAYGNDVYFTTGSLQTQVSTSAVTNISAESATLNGTITVEGSPAYTEKGFCYGTAANPTISNNRVVATGSGTGSFSKNISGLQYDVTYHVRAYAIQNGQPIYGNDVMFATAWTNTQVQTSAATNVSYASATFNGIVITEGSPAYTERGFCYSSTITQPTISSTKIPVAGSGEGNYSKSVSGLANLTTYYVRAYALQNGTPVYGDVVSFTTIWVDATVQTSAVTNISTTSAKFNGKVNNAGTPAYTEKGFCYSSSNPYPTVGDNRINMLANGTGNYYYTANGLSEGTTYYVRAYVMQDGSPVYGNVVTFTTSGQTVQPVVYTNEVSNLTPNTSGGIIMSWSVRFNGSVSNAGSPAYVERGFCYGTSMNPTGNRQVVSGTGTGSFYKNVTGLSNYQTYYVRAYVKTASGTYIYGQNEVFQTFD